MLKSCKNSDVCKDFFNSERCQSGPDSPYWKEAQLIDTRNDTELADISKIANSTSQKTKETIVVDAMSSSVTLEEELIAAKKLYMQSKSAVVEMFNQARMGRAIAVEQADELVDNIRGSIARHPSAFISLVRLKGADEYTYMHSVAVCALMIAVAHQLDFSAELIHQAGLAGLLHEVGKMAIPGAILNKPGKLTEEEFDVIRQHPQMGARMLRALVPVCEMVVDVCLHHHEKIDGSGYPDRLAGEQISLFSRMAAICDVYDAVTSDRPYNEAWGPAIAIQKMSEWKRHFDSSVFQAFVKSVGIYPVGSIVRLSSGDIGVVVEQSPNSLLTPKVKIFYSPASNTYITPTLIDIGESAQSEKIIERVLAQQYGFKNTETLWHGSPAQTK